ncbi:hypothetical protein THASP1DRAFT_28689 [Thamnocephalis sphaerospora]|uniref:Glycine zipper domain-containing protein n=1 Tax=Thamnocephalis sphaerospora TaxID=78915 RepID=A0A4P9XVU4_9FUNG|nr:hypothetical protein THASP1DRAFT_28689 [Thamnocephalis sphaerospora]|eukprot:RKP09530.1 hypothetical protein THASP1DRAFT_28689 [Thamnocephalis sphaerospora]
MRLITLAVAISLALACGHLDCTFAAPTGKTSEHEQAEFSSATPGSIDELHGNISSLTRRDAPAEETPDPSSSKGLARELVPTVFAAAASGAAVVGTAALIGTPAAGAARLVGLAVEGASGGPVFHSVHKAVSKAMDGKNPFSSTHPRPSNLKELGESIKRHAIEMAPLTVGGAVSGVAGGIVGKAFSAARPSAQNVAAVTAGTLVHIGTAEGAAMPAAHGGPN